MAGRGRHRVALFVGVVSAALVIVVGGSQAAGREAPQRVTQVPSE
jgi:hypothetical protein